MIFKQLLCCTFLLAAVRASGDIAFLHYPSNIQFYGNQTMPQSIFRDVGSGLLGLSIKSQSAQPWDGVHLMSPFDAVNALVVITVDGIDTLSAAEGYHFPLHCDQGEENTWVGLNTRLQNQSTDSLKIRMELEAGPNAFGQSAFGALKFVPVNYTHLKADNDADRVFIEEMQLLRAIAANIPSEKKFTQDRKTLIWLTVAGLTPLIRSHGKSSDAAVEAQTELIKVLDIVTKAFEQVYNGQVVVAAFTSCGDVARNDTVSVYKRDTSNADVKKLIPAKKYSENYPVIFNLLLWFTVVFIFSLIAICVAIADMDPGRDSIIYRMTSNRMKKDN